jgi:hypothetical protein
MFKPYVTTGMIYKDSQTDNFDASASEVRTTVVRIPALRNKHASTRRELEEILPKAEARVQRRCVSSVACENNTHGTTSPETGPKASACLEPTPFNTETATVITMVSGTCCSDDYSLICRSNVVSSQDRAPRHLDDTRDISPTVRLWTFCSENRTPAVSQTPTTVLSEAVVLDATLQA